MSLHWTYSSFDPEADLQQGDILIPTPELRSLFDEIHKHFCDDKYLAFLVASQSCDLVRHKGKKEPKARYISVSVVRSLDSVIQKLIRSVSAPLAPGIFPSSRKGDARMLVERIFNQNEQAAGIFYLHPSEAIRIGVPAVSMLRITLSLKAEHYSTLVNARSGRLSPEFQAKLGWLMGNLYNRPATPDWSDYDGGGEQFEELVKEYVGTKFNGVDQSTPDGLSVSWIDKVIADKAKEGGLELEKLKLRDIDSLRPPPVLNAAISEIANVLKDVAPNIADDVVGQFERRLRNHAKFKRLLVKNVE